MEKSLAGLLLELQKILESIKAHTIPKANQSSFNAKTFFQSIRSSLFKRLRPPQVEGIEAKIHIFQSEGSPLSFAAYMLATSYHETAQRMLPVREGLNASDGWRRRNLRYYPYYGRGDVQLTWLANYKRADLELGLAGALVKNLDLALDKDISAKILVKGMTEGWFTGQRMIDYLPADREANHAEFRRARRIVNLMDKADLIAGYAVKFQTALQEAGYGNPNSR